jgi:hypothetical protein
MCIARVRYRRRPVAATNHATTACFVAVVATAVAGSERALPQQEQLPHYMCILAVYVRIYIYAYEARPLAHR